MEMKAKATIKAKINDLRDRMSQPNLDPVEYHTCKSMLCALQWVLYEKQVVVPDKEVVPLSNNLKKGLRIEELKEIEKEYERLYASISEDDY